MKPYLATLLVVATAAGGATVWAAGSDGWVPADEAVEVEPAATDYDVAMAEGDEKALMAAGEAASLATIKKLINGSISAYERAATADPKAAEPHWRAANVIYGFFLDCEQFQSTVCDNSNRKLMRRVVDHWVAFEESAPLDPRLTVGVLGAGLLFDRAILLTKLGSEGDLVAATSDYETWLDRAYSADANRAIVLGNLAETHMMLGDLESAIERYREAYAIDPDPSIAYGLAVAYDRDDQGGKAQEIMRALGESSFKSWREKVDTGATFYVPDGEVFYYYALAYESLGHDDDALKHWKYFVASGAHPRYQERARTHLRALEHGAESGSR